MELFAESLRAHRDELDSLNVYPVPDGDTGTNLLMTQEAVVAALSSLDGDADLAALGGAIARASLMGARGNSGVILSQVLRGICEEPPDDGGFGPRQLAAALERAAEEAHRAVSRPVEGTVLSVIRDAARAATGSAQEVGGDLPVVEAALEEARASLARTPELLPDLALAGVVDAGGKGVVLLLDSLRAALAGDEPSEPIGPLGPVGRMNETPAAGALEFGYEVQYLLEAADEVMPSLRRALAELGDSLVVVGGNGLFNVHVHTNDPGEAVERGNEAGRPSDIQIVDLQGKVMECLGGHARAVRLAEQTTALVAVAEGGGLVSAFSSLGAAVVRGGPGRNPSVQELLEAIEGATAHGVVVLPNHRNVFPAARAAADLATKQVHVVPSSSIPSGLAAATVFGPLAQPGENARAMEEAAEACGWGEVVMAERDAWTPAGEVKRGDWMGVARDEVVSVGGSAAECAGVVARRLPPEDAEVVTLIEGAGATGEDRESVRAAIRAALPDLDLQVMDGGQPLYPFLLGVE